MASITKIVILITAIIVINGDALYVLSNDTDRPDDRISDTSSYVKRDPPYKKRCDDGVIDLFFGCTVTTVRSLIHPINRDYYEVMRPKDPSSPNTEYVISKNGGLRARRQGPVKTTKGSDDGPNVVMSLLARSNSPLRSMIRNRNRRSPSIQDSSSNKKNKVVIIQTPVSNRPPKRPIGKNLITTFLTTLYSPYALIF
ncbi:unnamed protein product [Macrosiphum euphorbiae]|uniref:Uncharacterized protein n=1 Tax=Macrosiphum euphorbiae TaxID=13131 RepID=A0AAV0WB17_9HEMI|nr:unnamed protein product [Macrosiphum euphorbiae]